MCKPNHAATIEHQNQTQTAVCRRTGRTCPCAAACNARRQAQTETPRHRLTVLDTNNQPVLAHIMNEN